MFIIENKKKKNSRKERDIFQMVSYPNVFLATFFCDKKRSYQGKK